MLIVVLTNPSVARAKQGKQYKTWQFIISPGTSRMDGFIYGLNNQSLNFASVGFI